MRQSKFACEIVSRQLVNAWVLMWLPSIDTSYVHAALTHMKMNLRDWEVIAIALRLQSTQVVEPEILVQIAPGVRAVVVRILSAATTHAYLVKGTYVKKLRDAFEACEVVRDYDTAIDTCWNELQRRGRWYGLTPQLGTQRKGYSDIEKCFVDFETFISTVRADS